VKNSDSSIENLSSKLLNYVSNQLKFVTDVIIIPDIGQYVDKLAS